jgi:hypothetical protein
MKSFLYIASCLLSFTALPIIGVKYDIYVDQVTLYSLLAPCAQDRVSAVVRGQSSGCGQSLSSFTCFCMEPSSSSKFSSIISLAVENKCAEKNESLTLKIGSQRVTRTTSERIGTDVVRALEVFDSYCAMSTKLNEGLYPTFSKTLPIGWRTHSLSLGK